MSDKKEIPTKHKIVGGVIVGAVVLAVASNFIHPFSAKEVAIDTAKGAGKLALEKGKEKLADMKAQHDAKVAANQANQVATSNATPVGNTSSGNNLKNVESEQFISIDKVSIKSDEADLMEMNAIEAGDLDRVKYLIDSGINQALTDNEVCYAYIDRSGGEDFRSFEKQSVKFPKDVVEMKTLIALNANKKPLVITSKCSKLFLLKAAEKLNANYNQDEFPYYNRNWTDKTDQEIIKQDKDKIADETKREQIYALVLSKTQDKDLYLLPYVFLSSKVPYSIRKEALDKYLSFGDKFPTTQSRTDFLKMYDDAAAQLLTTDPNNRMLMDAVSNFKNPWNLFFANETSRFINYAKSLQSTINSLMSTYNVDKKYHSDVSNLEIPALTVQSLMQGGVKYTESTNSILWYYGAGRGMKMINKYDFQILYSLNKEIKIMNTIVDSKKINLNAQDLQGNTILHSIASLPSDARPQAVVTRYLLNNGVNANLMNKAGKTAFMIAQEKQSQNNGGWGEISKAYTDKDYN